MLERRKLPRLAEEWNLSYRVLHKDQFANDPMRQYTVNISGGGICLMAEKEIKEDTMLALELESDQFPAPILALAKTVRCKRTRSGHEVGCELWWVGLDGKTMMPNKRWRITSPQPLRKQTARQLHHNLVNSFKKPNH